MQCRHHIWHSPSNAHAYRLLIVKEHHRFAFAFAARRSVIGEDQDSRMLFKALSSFRSLRRVAVVLLGLRFCARAFASLRHQQSLRL
jgi:hypothetical protein